MRTKEDELHPICYTTVYDFDYTVFIYYNILFRVRGYDLLPLAIPYLTIIISINIRFTLTLILSTISRNIV